MTRIGWKIPFGIFLAVAGITTIVLSWTKTKGAYPLRASLGLVIVLLVIAAVVVFLGWRVRKWVRTGEDFDPIGATRTLALGQSAAIVGPVAAGYFLGQILVSIAHLPAPEPAGVVSAGSFALGAAIALTGAGLFTQWCCQVPPSDDDHDAEGRPRHG